MLSRRDLVVLAGGAAAWPLRAEARTPEIGVLSSFTETQSVPAIAAFRRGLGETGLVEGAGFSIAFRYSDGQYQRLPALADELVRRPSDLLLCVGERAALAAKAVTATIPIVFVVGSDPVGFGLVASLRRPGGNVTGATHMSDGVVQKRLEILFDLVPGAARVAMLANVGGAALAPEARVVREVLGRRGIELRLLNAATPGEIDSAFAALMADRPDALFVGADPFLLTRAPQLVAAARRLERPVIWPFREFSAAGGLVSYGTNRNNTYRLAGGQAARILKGAKPADLPVQQPTLFELAVNLKEAKALGLTVSPALLARADEVIE